MIKFFYKLFNHDKIDDLNKSLDVYKERNEQLEEEIKEYKGYKLKYQVAKMLVDDDDAILELLEASKKKHEVQRNDYVFARDSDFYRKSAASIACAAGAQQQWFDENYYSSSKMAEQQRIAAFRGNKCSSIEGIRFSPGIG